METTITSGDLLTVAGAGAAALIVAQFAKMLFSLPPVGVRTVALVTGLAVVVTVTVLSWDQLNIVELILAVIVGMQAGMSAWSMADASRSGLNYATNRPDA